MKVCLNIIVGLCVVATTCGVLGTSHIAHATAFDDPGSRVVAPGGGPLNGGGLEPSKPEVDGGELSVGATQQIVVLFRNSQSQPIRVGAVNLYPSSTVTASVSMNDCAKEPLPPGAECPIALNVSAFQTGPWRVEMLVRHDGRTKVVTATVKGTVAAGKDGDANIKPDLQPVPDKIDFGTLNNGKKMVRSIVLRNVTSSDITVKDVTLQASSNAEYTLETNCEKLTSGQACLISLSWSPKQKGPSEGFVVIQHDGSTSVTSVPITAKFEPASSVKAPRFPDTIPGRGVLVASDEEIDFGEEVDSESSYTLSLVNEGDSDLEIENITLSGADTGLSLLRKGCVPGTILAPVEACPLVVVWSPVRTGEVRDDVQITHDGARGVLVVPISGKATKTFNPDAKTMISRNGTYARQIDRTQILQGYVVSSHSPTRAIINGPGGSRVVMNNQIVTLGGVQWTTNIVENGVEMIDGDDRVLLLFDRSLSVMGGASTSSSSSSDSSSSSGTTSTGTTTTPSTP